MKGFEKTFIYYMIILQILLMYRNIVSGIPQTFVYFCNHIPIIIAFFLLFERYDYLKAIINIGLLIQMGWVLDFLSKLIFDFYIFGSTSYIFSESFNLSIFLSILIHTTTLIPLFFIIRNKKTKLKTIYYSIAYLLILFLVSIMFTNPIYDINCVHSACNVNFLQFENFVWFYIPFAIFFLIIPTYLIQKKFEIDKNVKKTDN